MARKPHFRDLHPILRLSLGLPTSTMFPESWEREIDAGIPLRAEYSSITCAQDFDKLRISTPTPASGEKAFLAKGVDSTNLRI